MNKNQAKAIAYTVARDLVWKEYCTHSGITWELCEGLSDEDYLKVKKELNELLQSLNRKLKYMPEAQS